MEDKLEETPVKVDIATENSHSVSSTSDDHIYGNESLLGRPVGVDELSVYIDEMLKRQDGFKEEYMVSGSDSVWLHRFMCILLYLWSVMWTEKDIYHVHIAQIGFFDD